MLGFTELSLIFEYDPESGTISRKGDPNAVPIGSPCRGHLRTTYTTGNKTKFFYCHRLAHLLMTGDWPARGMEIDHVNGDRGDNRWANLRVVTLQQNRWNRHHVSGAIPYKGVRAAPKRSRLPYQAMISLDNRQIYLGTHPTPEDAARAYDAKARELFGEFAKTNFA